MRATRRAKRAATIVRPSFQPSIDFQSFGLVNSQKYAHCSRGFLHRAAVEWRNAGNNWLNLIFERPLEICCGVLYLSFVQLQFTLWIFCLQFSPRLVNFVWGKLTGVSSFVKKFCSNMYRTCKLQKIPQKQIFLYAKCKVIKEDVILWNFL